MDEGGSAGDRVKWMDLKTIKEVQLTRLSEGLEMMDDREGDTKVDS